MKDLIKFCMVHHEPEIKKLSKSPLGGQRFELFIRRHEMNVAPPPEVSSPPDKYVIPRFQYSASIDVIFFFFLSFSDLVLIEGGQARVMFLTLPRKTTSMPMTMMTRSTSRRRMALLLRATNSGNGHRLRGGMRLWRFHLCPQTIPV